MTARRDDDQRDGNAIRGILYALPVSLLLWVLIIWAVIA